MDVEGDDEVGELAGGDPDDDLWDEEGEFTGFKMQRLTCLFRLDATPKRRPQVSHTKANGIINKKNPVFNNEHGYEHTLFTGMDEKVLKKE